VAEAEDGLAALQAVAAVAPDLVLLDVQMPRLDGIGVTRTLRARDENVMLPIILVTALDDTASKVAGLDAGATDFVTKPFEPAELLARVRSSLRTRSALQRLESAQDVLVALANAVEAKDPTTEKHCSRIAAGAVALARMAGLSDEMIEAVGYGAVLHDVGKIGVPEALLRKEGPLDEAEWSEMRRHPLIGASIVEPLRLGRLVGPMVRGHHERWDGSGYPDGLVGAAIPIGARIVAVVDAHDAMTHDRPYRLGMPADAARRELEHSAGSQFDANIVRLYLAYLEAPAMQREDPALSEYTRGLFQTALAS